MRLPDRVWFTGAGCSTCDFGGVGGDGTWIWRICVRWALKRRPLRRKRISSPSTRSLVTRCRRSQASFMLFCFSTISILAVSPSSATRSRKVACYSGRSGEGEFVFFQCRDRKSAIDVVDMFVAPFRLSIVLMCWLRRWLMLHKRSMPTDWSWSVGPDDHGDDSYCPGWINDQWAAT